MLLAARASNFEALLTHYFSYGGSMGLVAALAFAAAAIVISLGPEAHRISFGPAEKPDIT